MSNNMFGLIEMGLTLFVCVGWGLWELHKLKKDK
jgi:hypothetical protein